MWGRLSRATSSSRDSCAPASSRCSGDDQAEVDTYFSPGFRFHRPDGFESPAGPIPPNGRRVVFDLINIFQFDDEGRLAEEWVQTDYRSFLRQIGAEGR
ncbi:MAG: ester cyclase [Nocardioidaceae bacterium]